MMTNLSLLSGHSAEIGPLHFTVFGLLISAMIYFAFFFKGK